MTINEYQKEALRTEPTRQKSAQWGDWVEPHQWRMQLENGLMGLNGEAGEAIDLLKKHLFQGIRWIASTWRKSSETWRGTLR